MQTWKATHDLPAGPSPAFPSGLQFQSTRYTGQQTGPRLIVLGAMHGNETCGTQAIQRVISEIDHQLLTIAAGSVTFVPIANPLAYALGQRSGERNLNRNLMPTAQPSAFEDHVANCLCPLLEQHDVLLDLHSFHTEGAPFAMLGPQDNHGALEPFARAAEEQALARCLGVNRFVDGWLDTYAKGVRRRLHEADTPTALRDAARFGIGTTEYMRAAGGYGVTLECGQHTDPLAPAVAYRAILNTLAFLGLTGGAAMAATDPTGAMETLRLCDVIDRATDGDRFSREWASFDRLHAGEVIGTRGDGTCVTADRAGFILFPNPAAAIGQEWFYLAEMLPPSQSQMTRSLYNSCVSNK